jgi:hypothetical protein
MMVISSFRYKRNRSFYLGLPLLLTDSIYANKLTSISVVWHLWHDESLARANCPFLHNFSPILPGIDIHPGSPSNNLDRSWNLPTRRGGDVLPVAAQRIELPYMKVCGDEISQSYARYESSETRKLVRIDCHQNYR